jgi:hypothetical protein
MTDRTPAQLIEHFYASFAALDGTAMQAAYASDASFEDPAFSLRGADEIGAMWRMLTDGVRTHGMDVWRLEYRDITDHSAHWEATYRFGASGRRVHNVIDARFEFDAQGRIVRHVDSFDFWLWARQALGPVGLVAGWTPMLRRTVRQQASANLRKWRAKQARA